LSVRCARQEQRKRQCPEVPFHAGRLSALRRGASISVGVASVPAIGTVPP
jgi:hypothetical protein